MNNKNVRYDVNWPVLIFGNGGLLCRIIRLKKLEAFSREK